MMSNHHDSKTILIIVLIASSLCFLKSVANAGTAWLTIGKPQTIPSGGTFETTFQVTTWDSVLGAYEVALNYDPALLQILQITVPARSEFSGNTYADSGSFSSGSTSITGFQNTYRAGHTSPSTLAAVKWKALAAPGKTATIAIHAVQVMDFYFRPIGVESGMSSMTFVDPALLRTVTSTATGNGTLVCESPVNIGANSTCTITPDIGNTLVTLTDNGQAVPLPLPDPGNLYIIHNVDVDHNVGATFKITEFTLPTSAGQDGSLSCTPNPVDYGSSVTYTITPAAGYHLESLTDNGRNVTSQVSDGLYTITNVTAAHTVTAAFASDRQILTVTKSGTGGLAVAPSTGTLSWNGNTGTATYDHDAQVILIAVPEVESNFTGWSGACTGKGDCKLIMDNNKTIFAGGVLKGDVNDDGAITLADAILALRIFSGVTLDPATINKWAFVNTDGKIDLAGVIFILQKVARVR